MKQELDPPVSNQGDEPAPTKKGRGLQNRTAAEMAPLERLTPMWPDAMFDLACGIYLALMERTPDGSLDQMAELAVYLVRGIVDFMGGSQPYISTRNMFKNAERERRVLDLWLGGASFKTISTTEGISERGARYIVARWRKKSKAMSAEAMPAETGRATTWWGGRV